VTQVDATVKDEELASLAKAGDRAAFDALVRRHKVSLYRFVRHYVGNADDAYDVLQEAFIAAWRGLRKFDPARAFAPWLKTIALNKCRDYGRRRTIRRLLLQTYASELPQFPDVDTSDEQLRQKLQENRRLSRLDHAIATLPPIYKEPLLLTLIAGLSHQEVADILKTTPKAIEVRLYRARIKLREKMESD